MLGVLVGAAGFWSLSVLVDGDAPASEVDAPILVAAELTELSRVEELPATVSVTEASVIPAPRAGTVTGRQPDPRFEVARGSVVIEIDLVPVIAIAGEVPMFRELGVGDEGPDVEQLQVFLADQGFLTAEEVDGDFGGATASAVRAWKRSLGEAQPSSTVEEGRLLSFPSLPMDVRYDQGAIVGAGVAVGDPMLVARTGDASVSIAVDPRVAATFDVDTPAVVDDGGGQGVPAVVVEQRVEERSVALVLEPIGGEFCDRIACDLLTEDDELIVTASIEVLAPTVGIGVPSAALRTAAHGQTTVVTADGEVLEVTVVARDRGQVIVEGVDAGTMIRIG